MRKHRRLNTLLQVIAILLLTSIAPAQIRYAVVPISSPFDPPGYVAAWDINNHAAVAAVDEQAGRADMGFVWRAGKGTPIPSLGGTCSTASGLNNAEHVVGYACLPGDVTTHAFLYRNQHITDIDTFGSVSSDAWRVNRHDQVIGGFTTADGVVHSFFWEKDQWQDLGFLGGSNTTVWGMNDSGVVTGQSDISNDPDPVFGIPHFHSFVWSGGTLTDMGQIFGSDFGYASAVDAAGRITGSADLPGDTAAHAYLWDQGKVTDLSPYGDNMVAWGNDMNSRGDIVGAWGGYDSDPEYGPPVDDMLCPCYATLWQNGKPLFLESLVEPGWELLLGLWINDHGQIIALGRFNGGSQQRVLLQPIPMRTPPGAKVARKPARSFPRGFHRERNGSISVLR